MATTFQPWGRNRSLPGEPPLTSEARIQQLFNFLGDDRVTSMAADG